MSRSVLLALGLVGCEAIESTEVGTDAIYADFAATSDGSSTHATAFLRLGGGTSNTFVDLEGDDRLTVSSGEQTVEMSEANIGEIYGYDADLDVFAEDSELVFSLERTIDAGAPESSCTLPALFELSAPAADAAFSRDGDPLTISWTPSGEQDAIRILVVGDCFWAATLDVSGDPGSYVVEPGTLVDLDPDNPTACDATITVQRRRSGNLDAGYGEGGSIFGIQARQVGIRSDP